MREEQLHEADALATAENVAVPDIAPATANPASPSAAPATADATTSSAISTMVDAETMDNNVDSNDAEARPTPADTEPVNDSTANAGAETTPPGNPAAVANAGTSATPANAKSADINIAPTASGDASPADINVAPTVPDSLAATDNNTTTASNEIANNHKTATDPRDRFNPHHPRARAAKFRRLGNSALGTGLLTLAVIALVAGAGALFWLGGWRFGWLLLALADVLLVFLIWLKNEAKTVPTGKGDTISDLLSGDLLNILAKTHPGQASATQFKLLADQIPTTISGRFLAVRLGVSTPFLTVVADALASQGLELADVFARARTVRTETDSEQINGAVLAVAMTECMENYQLLLGKMKLEPGDLREGVVWYSYLHGRVRSAKARRKTGGIARDLNFGYIPTLEQFGTNLSEQVNLASKTQMHSPVHQAVLDQMEQVFSAGGRQNVALIGPDGSGRSTIVRAFAEDLLDADSGLPRGLKFRQVFQLSASALLSATGNNLKIESLLTRIFNEAHSAKNIIIWLEDAQLFFEDGTGSVDLTNLLLPVVEGGALRLVLTMEEQKFLEISAKNSSLANALNKIYVKPTDGAATFKIMEDQVPLFEYQHGVIYDFRALREAYNLSERYVHDLEMPGRALNLLETAADYAEAKLVTAEAVQRAVESTAGVKVQVAESAADREKLLNLEDRIHERMVDQAGAVKTVAGALRRAAAGVRNTARPIGTFLFLGPTGVGKTELAKSLSEVYFGGEKHIVRIDLNEYVSADDVARLIADGTVDALSLTAQVMKQPFAVVLLDEIEKAHPQVLTTLLQLLDEGILRDIKNREVSFRDTIVIATSNAGASTIRELVAAGTDLNQVKDQLTNQLIASGEFKPEFLNRFDEICVFQPLGPDELLRIVDIILASVNAELAGQKIQVLLAPEAKALLVERGYDPQLGARPMRRIIQKSVENIVAGAVLSGVAEAGTTLSISAEMVEKELAENGT